MYSVDRIRKLARAGSFAEAFRELDISKLPAEHRLPAQVLKAELLERLGRLHQSGALVESLQKSRNLSTSERSACEYVLGKIALENGRVEPAITHFQRADSLAQRANDLGRSCWACIALMLIVSERSGPDAVTPLLARIRLNATKLGDPIVTAALHVFVGEMEAKRGLFHSARRHSALALQILKTSPNCWLESAAENTRFAVAVLQSDFRAGLMYGSRALELAEASGAASIQRACLGNLGNLSHAVGDFDRADDYLQRALALLQSTGENNNANLDGLARVRLSQNRPDECAVLLEQIDSCVDESNRVLYAHRYAALTRTQLLARQGQIQEALRQSQTVLNLAESAGDELLSRNVLLVKAELLQRVGLPAESLKELESILQHFPSSPPDMYAQYERVVALMLTRAGDWSGADLHRSRAARICKGLGGAHGLLLLSDETALESRTHSLDASGRKEHDPFSALQSVLHGVTTVLLHGARPEVAARELIALLDITRSVHSAKAVRRNANGSADMVAYIGRDESVLDDSSTRHLVIGQGDDSQIELVLHPKEDTESWATINAITLLLTILHELQHSRAEREERATLWPVDELPVEGDRAVVSGHMREQMTYARRVARTNVTVLISGESGTGKEILAHTIHTCSDRAHKPFVPVNCAAVPRELLESQLFGHRRGAFTGADRDHSGFIRAAQGGTLFLDEIAELRLDLQPKLLRFLESGEISPLGEPTPLTVDVRIVAATNRNLDDLVRDGLFREDLFYRLNVVPLFLKPLRERRDEIPGLVHYFVGRAANEFKKGHLTVAEETVERLLLYRWPGNVRQLQNELRRMVALAESNATLLPDEISDDILGSMPLLRQAPANGREIAVPLGDKLPQTIARVECEMIKVALKEHHGKVDATAKALGISRKGLYLKRQRLGL